MLHSRHPIAGDGLFAIPGLFDMHSTRMAPLLADSDAPDSFAFPGSAIHDELDHLVEAGLSPLEALRSATFEPARFLNLEGQACVESAAGSWAMWPRFIWQILNSPIMKKQFGD
jgi:hypothetical protein